MSKLYSLNYNNCCKSMALHSEIMWKRGSKVQLFIKREKQTNKKCWFEIQKPRNARIFERWKQKHKNIQTDIQGQGKKFRYKGRCQKHPNRDEGGLLHFLRYPLFKQDGESGYWDWEEVTNKNKITGRRTWIKKGKKTRWVLLAWQGSVTLLSSCSNV